MLSLLLILHVCNYIEIDKIPFLIYMYFVRKDLSKEAKSFATQRVKRGFTCREIIVKK